MAELEEVDEDQKRVILRVNGQEAGAHIADNVRGEDGYRFHDVFHLANVAVLGWSPVLRKGMGIKRKSLDDFDDAEDGGRAIVLEEAVVALTFEYARNHEFRELQTLDFSLLKTVKQLTANLEINRYSASELEEAILLGYRMWHAVRARGGGTFDVNLEERSMVLRD